MHRPVPVGDDGAIDPTTPLAPRAAELDSADAIVMLLRFRAWPDEQMKHFVDAYRRGVPIIALRTSTHAFKYDSGTTRTSTPSKARRRRGMGQHWDAHKAEATRGVVEPSAKDDRSSARPDVFGDSDVYDPIRRKTRRSYARPGAQGHEARRPAGRLRKKRATDKQEHTSTIR